MSHRFQMTDFLAWAAPVLGGGRDAQAPIPSPA
jgi:hypothetical protein